LAVYFLLTALLLAFTNQFVLVSFDRQSALVMGKNVLWWDLLLYAIIGIAISMSVIIVGPMLTFAYLIIPPLAARRFCKRMTSFFIVSSLFGGVSGLLGFLVSYHLDWPLAPTDIAVVSLLLLTAYLAKKIQHVIIS
jgi:ABC-type Mn2+/Zn2+ transport system permease subunit